MIAGLDSATPPTLAAVKAGAAKDVRLWSGYLATKANVGLYHAWTLADFDVARQAGSEPIGFCSGWDDPVAIKALAAAWRVKPCLDVEGGGLRPDGAWVQPWLSAAESGLYGNWGVHTGRTARFHVLGAYPGSADVQATWWNATPRPAGPCGWQWCGTHPEFGTGCDRGDYDDWFGPKRPIHSSARRRNSIVATTKSLHQFCRGGDHALWHRRRAGGTWSPWASLGGRLAPDSIVTGVDDKGTIIVSVAGGTSDGSASNGLFYDYVSTDDGLTFSGPAADAGGGDSLSVISVFAPAAAAAAADLTPVLAALADIKAHPAVVSDPALLAAVQTINGHFSGH